MTTAISPTPVDELAEQIRLFKRILTDAIRRVFTAEQVAERAEKFDRSDELRRIRRDLEGILLRLRGIESTLPGLGGRITSATEDIRDARTSLETETARLKRTTDALNAATQILAIALRVVTLLS